MRVAVAGSLATKMVLGEDTNFNIADIKRVRRMAERFVFYYGAQPLPQRNLVSQLVIPVLQHAACRPALLSQSLQCWTSPLILLWLRGQESLYGS
jgi:hypothetical protein